MQYSCRRFARSCKKITNLVSFLQIMNFFLKSSKILARNKLSPRSYAKFRKHARNPTRSKLSTRILQEKTLCAKILQVSLFIQESARILQDLIFLSSRNALNNLHGYFNSNLLQKIFDKLSEWRHFIKNVLQVGEIWSTWSVNVKLRNIFEVMWRVPGVYQQFPLVWHRKFPIQLQCQLYLPLDSSVVIPVWSFWKHRPGTFYLWAD